MAKRRVFHPGLGRHIVIGACKLPKHPPVGLKLKDFLAAFPASPPTCDYTPKAASVIADIEGNDTYGDCVFAENAHFIGVVTGNANTLFSYTEAQALADYSAETGFNPSDPNTDQGADPTVDLNYFTQHPYADGSKNAGWALVDATNQAEVRYAVSAFGNVKMWFGIPDSIVSSMPSASGFIWDVAAGSPDQNNGHCIGGYGYSPVGYSSDGLLVATWGMLGLVTWAALASWFAPSNGGGLAVRVTQDWVSKASGKTPEGVNYSALVTAFNMYFGGSLPVPAPPTPPPAPPTPPPASGPTLAQAQSAVTNAFAKGYPFVTKGQAESIAAQALVPLWP